MNPSVTTGRSGTGRVGAPGREREPRTERIRRAQQRPDVPGVADVPQRQGHVADALRQVGAAVEPEDARRVAEGRDLREELGLDRLPGDEQLDRRDPRC